MSYELYEAYPNKSVFQMIFTVSYRCVDYASGYGKGHQLLWVYCTITAVFRDLIQLISVT